MSCSYCGGSYHSTYFCPVRENEIKQIRSRENEQWRLHAQAEKERGERLRQEEERKQKKKSWDDFHTLTQPKTSNDTTAPSTEDMSWIIGIPLIGSVIGGTLALIGKLSIEVFDFFKKPEGIALAFVTGTYATSYYAWKLFSKKSAPFKSFVTGTTILAGLVGLSQYNSNKISAPRTYPYKTTLDSTDIWQKDHTGGYVITKDFKKDTCVEVFGEATLPTYFSVRVRPDKTSPPIDGLIDKRSLRPAPECAP